MNDKWKKIDQRMEQRQRKESGSELPNPDHNPGVPSVAQQQRTPSVPGGATPDKVGLFGGMQISREARRANVEMWKEAYKQKLEVWKTKIKAESDLAQQEILLAYKGELEKINAEHIAQLREIGITNFESRSLAIRELGLRVSALLDKCQGDDVPEFVREKNFDAITNMYSRLFDEMQNEKIDGKFDGESG